MIPLHVPVIIAQIEQRIACLISRIGYWQRISGGNKVHQSPLAAEESVSVFSHILANGIVGQIAFGRGSGIPNVS